MAGAAEVANLHDDDHPLRRRELHQQEVADVGIVVDDEHTDARRSHPVGLGRRPHRAQRREKRVGHIGLIG